MELYNFFTEMVEDKSILDELMDDLNEVCHFVHIVEWPKNTYGNTKERYSIIGQIYGDDTSVGDLSLLDILSEIKYTWFDAFCPEINNL